MTRLGVDVGGTWTRIGAVDHSEHLRAVCRFATPREAAADALLALINRSIQGIRAEAGDRHGPVLAVGLALPGILDAGHTTVLRSVSLSQLEGYPLAASLAEVTRLPVRLVTDADAATWGEYVAFTRSATVDTRPVAMGKAQASPRFVHLRLGTGIACGLVAEGCLAPIEPVRTGHLTVLVVDESAGAPMCRCGKQGCLETIASGHALSQRARHAGIPDGLPELEDAFRKAEPIATALIAEAAKALQRAIIRIADQLQPDAICLGGGVLTILPSLLDETVRGLGARTHCDSGERASGRLGSVSDGQSPVLCPSLLADNAGLIGAALLAAGDAT